MWMLSETVTNFWIIYSVKEFLGCIKVQLGESLILGGMLMSSYVVGTKTMNRIMSYIYDQIRNAMDGPWWQRMLEKWVCELKLPSNSKPENLLSALGTAFFKQNLLSVSQLEIDQYTYTFVNLDEKIDRMQVYKTMFCLNYQSGDGTADETPVFKVMEKWQLLFADIVIQQLPEFDMAEYG